MSALPTTPQGHCDALVNNGRDKVDTWKGLMPTPPAVTIWHITDTLPKKGLVLLECLPRLSSVTSATTGRNTSLFASGNEALHRDQVAYNLLPHHRRQRHRMKEPVHQILESGNQKVLLDRSSLGWWLSAFWDTVLSLTSWLGVWFLHNDDSSNLCRVGGGAHNAPASEGPIDTTSQSSRKRSSQILQL